MTATAETATDLGACGWCGCPQFNHRLGKKGCKDPECGCAKYEPPKDRPAPVKVPGVVVDGPAVPGPLVCVAGPEPAQPGDVDLPVEPESEPSRVVATPAAERPVKLDVAKRRRRKPAAGPAAQAEVQDLTDIVDAELRPVAELMEADQPTERLDRCGHCTLIPSVRGQVRATQVGCPQHGSRAVAAAAAVEPAPIVEAQRVADVAAHVDAKRVEQLLRVDAELGRAQTEIDRLAGQLTARLTDLDEARREAAEAHNKAARLRMERDRAEKSRQKTAQLLDETAAALAEERTEHQATGALQRAAAGELEDLRAEAAELRAALCMVVGSDPAVLYQYDADQCTTEGCGSRYTVPVEHPHPLTPVTVLVVRREVPGA